MSNWKVLTAWLLAAGCSGLAATPALAQDRPAVELTGQLGAVRLLDDYGQLSTSSGVAGSVTYNFASPLAVEFTSSWFPRRWPDSYQTQGGQTLFAGAGLRVTFGTWRRLSLFGRLGPEMVHVTDTYRGADFGAATHLGVNLGGGISFRLSPRVIARSDVAVTLFPVEGTAQGQQTEEGAAIGTTWTLGAGLGYGLGPFRSTRENHVGTAARRLTVGAVALYAVGMEEIPYQSEVRQGGVGAFASYAVLPYCDIEAVTGLFQVNKFHSPFEGGRTLETLAGLKLGRRGQRFGVFATIRGGVETDTAAVLSGDFIAEKFVTHWAPHAALNFGGLLELYVRARGVIRLELGDTRLSYRDAMGTTDGFPVTAPAQQATNSISTTMGFGWRF